jgi:CrcB protein
MSAVALWAGVALLGGIGSVARFVLNALILSRVGGRFPVGTLAVNLTGSAVLGLLAGLALSGDAYLLAGTATIGAYTTFSTWMLESQRLAEDERVLLAAVNIALSLILGLGAAEVGRLIAGG